MMDENQVNWTPEEGDIPVEPADPISLQDVLDMDPMEAIAQVFQDPEVVAPPPDFTASTDVSMAGYTGLEPPIPSFEPFNADKIEIPRSKQLRQERQQRQASRIAIRQAQKTGDTETASRLADIERRARDAGSITPLDDELAVTDAFPFDAIPEREQPEQEPPKTDPGDAAKVAELRRTPVPLLTDYVGGNPAWDMGGEGVVEVLKEMVAVLKRIDDKLPQKATYSE